MTQTDPQPAAGAFGLSPRTRRLLRVLLVLNILFACSFIAYSVYDPFGLTQPRVPVVELVSLGLLLLTLRALANRWRSLFMFALFILGYLGSVAFSMLNSAVYQFFQFTPKSDLVTLLLLLPLPIANLLNVYLIAVLAYRIPRDVVGNSAPGQTTEPAPKDGVTTDERADYDTQA